MNKSSKFRRVIASFFLTIFLPTLLPNSLYASNNGPNAPEAQGFESVNATDMVNLATGDMAYTLPVMDVNGFPITMSYHGGVPLDLESSWTGLGWNLNTGAINRSLNSSPDDWKGGNSIDFIKYSQTETSYSVNVGVGISKAAEVGVGMSWGSNKGMTGSVYASVAMVSASIGTDGNYSVGLSAGVTQGGYTYGGGVTMSGNVNNGEKDFSVGVGVRTKSGLTAGMSTSLTGNGTSFSLGYSNSKANGLNTTGGSGAGSLSFASFTQGDWDVTSKGWYIPCQIYFISFGFGKRKVTYNLEKSYQKKGYGILYNNYLSQLNETAPDGTFNDYQNRFVYGDAYDQSLPQSEKEFIGDYDLEREKLNFTFASYDSYEVNATGISGAVKPKVFDNSTLFGMGYIGADPNSTDQGKQRVYYHNTNVSRKNFGTNLTSEIKFYFDGQFTQNTAIQELSPVINNVNTGNSLASITSPKSAVFNNRLQQGNFVEVFTNEQIRNGVAGSSGLLNPEKLSPAQRTSSLFKDEGIGGYKITAPDGKVYHFSLPVYSYEEVHRTIYKDNSENHVSEKRQYTPYATHWLLTAITGPDYFDSNNNKIADADDYGYWVRLEHGKWSDGYVWRNPTDKNMKDYMSNISSNIGTKDFGFYQFGRKQIYYLDKIVSNTHTAYFVKDLRYDSVGSDLNYFYSATSSIANSGVGGGASIVGENFTYKKQMQLMLKKIVLVKNEVAEILEQNINNGPNPLQLNTGGVSDYVDNYNPNFTVGGGFANEFGTNYNVKINQEQNVIDVKDFQNFDFSKAVKTVELNYNYNLAVKNHNYAPGSNLSNGSPGVIQNTPMNPNHGKLTLKSIKFLGRNNYDYMPPYQFEYDGEFKDVNQPYVEYPPNSIVQKTQYNYQNWNFETQEIPIKNVREKDEWGFRKERPEAWSLTKINTPTGASIEFEHEEDDFYTEAFSRRWWDQGLQFEFQNYNGSTFDIVVSNNSNENLAEPVDFRKYFLANDPFYMDFWLCVADRDWGGLECKSYFEKVNLDRQAVVPIEVNQNYMRLRLSAVYIPELDDSGDLFGHAFGINNSNYSEHPFVSNSRNTCVEKSGACSGDGFNIAYRLLASKVPQDETGGGLRVKSITLKDENNNAYKTSYYYNVPGTSKIKNTGNYKSSGITSYSPVKGTKYIPYQSELPSPGVMYEYVSMVAEKPSTGETLGETRYRFYVLRPVLDIFRENIQMNYDDGEMMFKADVTNHNTNNGYFDPSKTLRAKSIKVKVNTSLIGQFRSVEEYNNKGQLMNKSTKTYIHGEQLKALASLPESNANKVHRGAVKESFQSLKSIYTSDKDDNGVTIKNRLLSISSKEEFSSVLSATTSVGLQGKTIEKYSNTDPMTGTFNTIEKTKADGKQVRIEKIPAYSKYPAMGSKVNNSNNKHMLTQETMNLTSVNVSGVWKTTDASITTWNDTWAYRNEGIGQDQTDYTNKVWRKHKTFVWKDQLKEDGVFLTNVSKTNTFFDWGMGTPLSDKWQKLSEITRYTRWSMPIESKDINGNFASSKMGDKDTKILLSGNARYTEMYYSGAEYVKSSNLFDGEVKGANFRSSELAHTGKYSVKPTAIGDRLFEINGSSGSENYYSQITPYTEAFRPGKYKISFWASSQGSPTKCTDLMVNNVLQQPSEVIDAGCWKQFIYIVDIPANNPNNHVFLTVNQFNESNVGYYDDFRMHPISSSINSYVYDQETDELSYVLDGQNMGTAYKYDLAGRLLATYNEVVDADNGIQTLEGGFKISGQFKQSYKGVTVNLDQLPGTLDNCYIANTPLSATIKNECISSFENKFRVNVTGGSGNYTYQYKWKKNIANNIFTNYVSGPSTANIPYVPGYCDDTHFLKIWSFVAKVTDIQTGQSIEIPYEYKSGLCNNIIIPDRDIAGIEISKCFQTCGNNDYSFRIHLKDIGYGDNYQYEFAYYDPNTPFYSQTLNWIDVTATNGRFCPNTFEYVANANCPNGNYMKTLYFTYRVKNLSTGNYSYYTPALVMLECVNNCGTCKSINISPEEVKYSKEGAVIVKSTDGKILSVYNVNDLK